MRHPVEWVTASPAWEGTPQAPSADPMLLRFASDSFMQDLQQLLDKEPGALPALRAPKESFRARPLGKDASWTSPAPSVLKLYQPIHGHFYLVSAALVCRVPGFPDHEVHAAQKETVGFVIRRLRHGGGELAWTTSPVHGKRWIDADAAKLTDYEEVHPLAPLNFTVTGGRRRRLFVGLVPTATRDTYPAGSGVDPFPTSTTGGTPLDTRRTELTGRIVGAFISLADASTPAMEAAQFALLDLGDFLRSHLDAASSNVVYAASAPAASDARYALWSILNRTLNSTQRLRDAVQSALAQSDAITGESSASPSFPASLATDLAAVARALVPQTPTARGKTFADAIMSALPAAAATTVTEGQAASTVEVPKLAAVPSIDGVDAAPHFVIRCVYQRPACEPFDAPLVSAATEEFTFAQFFDFDAPSRPIRIPLPVDTSIKDLRKFRKNVSFVISEQLKNQMNQIGALKDVMSGKVETADSATLGFGMICSFSIPIITICALIVLMIFISLLNIVFWWVPFFKICFPFPKRAAA